MSLVWLNWAALKINNETIIFIRSTFERDIQSMDFLSLLVLSTTDNLPHSIFCQLRVDFAQGQSKSTVGFIWSVMESVVFYYERS